MSLKRVLLCIICPPLAVSNKGCGMILLTTIGWVCGWVPGVLIALAVSASD
jgi:uncharacterized membrane protein YqaE (UPF0057 family)